MYIFGHCFIALGIVWLVNYWRPWSEKVDYRILLIAAMLPDLIDKPLGHVILGWGNGRLWGHGIAFLLGIVAIHLWRRDPITRLLALGVGFHLIFDRMWEDPHTLIWPLDGFAFATHEIDIIPFWLSLLQTQPYIWITEGGGFLIAVAVTYHYRLYRRDELLNFIRTGYLEKLGQGTF